MTWTSNACYPFTIGFDSLFYSLDTLASHNTSFPPHNIVKIDDESYALEMAVAGFNDEEISITLDKSELIIAGSKKNPRTSGFIHHGIATRSFTKKFEIAEHIVVKEATIDNGILTVELKLEIPEELKPKQIPIGKKAD